MYVIKVGEVKLIQDGQSLSDPSFVHEAGGFSYFGDAALLQPFKSPYTIVVASETLQMLSLPKRQLDTFLGRDVGLDSADAVIAALKKCEALKVTRLPASRPSNDAVPSDADLTDEEIPPPRWVHTPAHRESRMPSGSSSSPSARSRRPSARAMSLFPPPAGPRTGSS
jgi:hypothetical protein